MLCYLACPAAGSYGPTAAAAGHAAAVAHRATDAYLAAFDGPGQQGEQPPVSITCNASGRACAAAVRPAAAPAPLRPAGAAAAPASQAPFASAWRQQPAAAPTAISLTNRNVLCVSVDWARQEAVVGTADHALYTVDLRRWRKARQLYSKAAGHGEWVSAVCHLPDGRIASGGLDSQIWLWPAAGSACTAANCRRLEGHAGSVAALAPVPAAPTCLLSAGYDKSVLCWDVSGRGRQQHVMAGHRAPVLQLVAAGGSAASGDRDGCLARWDVAAGKAVGGLVQAHAGHCTALAWWGGSGSSEGGSGSSREGGSGSTEAPLLLSGGQDGAVKLWDARCRQQAAVAAHASPKGCGAVGSIVCMGGLVLTAGADGTMRGLTSSLQLAWEPVKLPDFPYCAASCGAMLFVGCGDGSIVAIDAPRGSLCWSVRAAGSAVRTLDASGGLLIAGCDDGSVLLLDAAQPIA